MKSKEYAQQYLSAPYEDSYKVLGEILNSFFKEMLELRTTRNIKFDVGLLPIVKDLDAKFRKFGAIVNSDPTRSHNIKLNGFLEVLKLEFKPLYDLYIESKV